MKYISTAKLSHWLMQWGLYVINLVPDKAKRKNKDKKKPQKIILIWKPFSENVFQVNASKNLIVYPGLVGIIWPWNCYYSHRTGMTDNETPPYHLCTEYKRYINYGNILLLLSVISIFSSYSWSFILQLFSWEKLVNLSRVATALHKKSWLNTHLTFELSWH